jgi:hypothetical protein
MQSKFSKSKRDNEDTISKSKTIQEGSVISTKLNAKTEEERHEDSDESHEEVKKRNPDTDCHNPDFLAALRQRRLSMSPNLVRQNILSLREINLGQNKKKRIDLPEGVELSSYAGCKQNVWEFQKE